VSHLPTKASRQSALPLQANGSDIYRQRQRDVEEADVDDHELACRLVLDASEWLLAGALPAVDPGPELTDIVGVALRMRRPGDGLLGEHVDDGARRRRRRVWLLDVPHDRRPQCQSGDLISLALSDNGDVVAGALALRRRGLVLGTVASSRGLTSGPAYANASVRSIGIDRNRRPRVAGRVARATGAHLVPCPSSTASAASVLLGELDAHMQDGDDDERRSAAIVAVARSIGLHVSRLDGTRPVYNKPRPVIADLLICSRLAAGALLAEIRDARP
jgi:3'(2'), 5'-bisphosphate nucleotidase